MANWFLNVCGAEDETQVLRMLAKQSITELYPQPTDFHF